MLDQRRRRYSLSIYFCDLQAGSLFYALPSVLRMVIASIVCHVRVASIGAVG